jgi:pimeloyl-ACP methyl ester carboxylesterase
MSGDQRVRDAADTVTRVVDEPGTGLAGQTGAVSSARSVLGLLTAMRGRRDDALAVVNGLFGDALDEHDSPLATSMTIRAGPTVLPLERDGLHDVLAGGVGQVGSRICLLVHGLMSTESIWQYPDDAATTYGSLLADSYGVTPLSLRYNTGRRISANGRELAQLLNLLVRAWPVRIREINLIGHSMGGLVIRSACYYARTVWPRGRHLPIGRRWTTKVRRVVLVGVPNTGAPLEAFVNVASSTLWSLPVPATRLVGLGLDCRSAGIKDLRFGNIVDEDWLEQDPGARVRTQPHRVHRLRRADYLVVAGTVTSDPEHPLARMIGDALVTSSSAVGLVDGAGQLELIPGATTRLFPKTTHLALAHDEDVYAAIDNWWQ